MKMTRIRWTGLLAGFLFAFAGRARAQSAAEEAEAASESSWAERARFFAGARGSVGVPPGGRGIASMMGLELGVSADSGVGFGLHLLGVINPPAVPALGVPKAAWGLGAAADIRLYIQTVEPLTLYPTLSVGFLAGPAEADENNAVLPLVNPGFGARVRIRNVYCAFEFGLAGFTIPFVALGVGYEGPHRHFEAAPTTFVPRPRPQPLRPRIRTPITPPPPSPTTPEPPQEPALPEPPAQADPPGGSA